MRNLEGLLGATRAARSEILGSLPIREFRAAIRPLGESAAYLDRLGLA